MSSLFSDHPDSPQGFNYLQQHDPQPWIYSSSSSSRLSALGLSEDIYSQIKPFSHTFSFHVLGSPRIRFHPEDVILQEFLWNSLSKRDILKPYSSQNLRHQGGLDLFLIPNATVISTPLSIAVLDEDLKLVSECSHNAPEAVLKWYLSNTLSITPQCLDKSILANVQQSFNLGHWFIDSISRIFALQDLVDITNYSILVDTCKNDLSILSLDYFKPLKVFQTLPLSIYKVNTLLVPVVSDFSTRCLLAHDYIFNMMQIHKPCNHHIQDLLASPEPLKLYFSRQKVSRRKFINGDQVEAFLSAHGYIAISPEEYPFFDIAHLVKHAISIIGGNGAAMCNMISAPLSQLSLGIIYPETHFDDYYFRVSQSLGHCFSGILSTTHQSYHSLDQSIHNYYYPRISEDYKICLDRLEFLVNSLNTSSQN